MRASTIVLIVLIVWVFLSIPFEVRAEVASFDEAHAAASRYLDYLDQRFTSWGENVTPTIEASEELVHGDRLLGWVFHVAPDGFLIVPRIKEFGAVKAWSAEGRFDGDSPESVGWFVGELILRSVESAERVAGRSIEQISPTEWSAITTSHYRTSWTQALEIPAKSSKQHRGNAGMDYQEHDILLSTHWEQGEPYNSLFPAVYDNGEICREHALVGCVATAGAQAMRYWAWPTVAADGTYADRYTWTHMPDRIFVDSPQHEIDAIAELSHNVAFALNMEFHCNKSSSTTADLEGVLENRRYHDGLDVEHRTLGMVSYPPEVWYAMLKEQFNMNRPVIYRVDRHAIVGDGWYEVDLGGSIERWYHFNYGWGPEDDIWYLLDVIPNSDPPEEYMLRGLRPDISIGPNLAGFYETLWLPPIVPHVERPTRYFDRDVTGTNAEFEAGQGLQYLRPGFWIRNLGTESGDEIIFHGEPEAVTEFYHEAPFGDVKIRIHDGSVVIRGGGELALY
jgi:hypothetical protein